MLLADVNILIQKYGNLCFENSIAFFDIFALKFQTADTCILYDSDWNPQADLQAQGMLHPNISVLTSLRAVCSVLLFFSFLSLINFPRPLPSVSFGTSDKITYYDRGVR